jgi:hypothetical protein
LFLLIQVAAGCGWAPWLRGHEEFKRPPETSAGTARDYSTTFGADCKDSGYKVPLFSDVSIFFIRVVQCFSTRQKLFAEVLTLT